MTASLPMYDWPEVTAHTNSLWAGIRRALVASGIPAPAELTRPADGPWDCWYDPELLLSQTCGLPFSAKLVGKTTLLGAPDFDVPGAGPGEYYSVIIVAADSPASNLEDLIGQRFAYNMRESQSGWAALAALLDIPTHFGDLVLSGAHRASVQAVAEGRADAAAIDAVSWELARRHDPAAANVRVLTKTPVTPGLPYITSLANASAKSEIVAAIRKAITELPAETREALLLNGFACKTEADYAPLAKGWPEEA
ncbi:MAG: phosphate/phosphite/phosphonate ABC transporter substrate-binding protein [Pikeienuella sp.]